MKTTELIKKIQKIVEAYGDRETVICLNDEKIICMEIEQVATIINRTDDTIYNFIAPERITK